MKAAENFLIVLYDFILLIFDIIDYKKKLSPKETTLGVG
jgi:hypothetical protein